MNSRSSEKKNNSLSFFSLVWFELVLFVCFLLWAEPLAQCAHNPPKFKNNKTNPSNSSSFLSISSISLIINEMNEMEKRERSFAKSIHQQSLHFSSFINHFFIYWPPINLKKWIDWREWRVDELNGAVFGAASSSTSISSPFRPFSKSGMREKWWVEWAGPFAN